MANFMDFNVQTNDKTTLAKIFAQAAKLGYDVVAVNHIAPSIDSTLNKKKNQKDHHIIPDPKDLKLDDETFKSIKCCRPKFRQITRFSTVMEDGAQLQKLNTPQIQDFDIVAVQPLSEKILSVAVNTLKIDIVTIDVTQKLPFPIKRPMINVALERGIYFELQYSAAIRDSSCRKYMIANAQTLMRVCKGKNVIVSSGCKKAMDLRGPHDVANLCLLFGMTQEQAKAAISTTCQSLLLHAESRKIAKSTVGVVHRSLIEDKDKWILTSRQPRKEQDHNSGEKDKSEYQIKHDTCNNKTGSLVKRSLSETQEFKSKKPKLEINNLSVKNEIIK